MTEPLHIKYRPVSFDNVIGQDAVVASLSKILERGGSRAFLFAGPSGTGKTTLARIAAKRLGCMDKDILEIDAATYTGIEHMRSVQTNLQYRPFGKSEHRAVIVDECHMLSKSAWNSLLKIIEKPPDFVTWFFCTTEVGKVPATIKTRCTSYTLKPLPEADLDKIINRVAKREDITLNPGVHDLIIREAQGSPRQLLVNLELCRDVTDRKAAATILKTVLDSDATVELFRFITNGGGSWIKVMSIIDKMAEDADTPEGVRILFTRYINKALGDAKTDKEATRFLRMLEAFAGEYNPAEGRAPLLLSIGRVMFSQG